VREARRGLGADACRRRSWEGTLEIAGVPREGRRQFMRWQR